MEDFETNNFNSFAWEHGTYPWYITTSNVFEGTYSWQCSKQSLGITEVLISIMWTSTVDDSLTLYRKISSEAGYDVIRVYIDSAIVEAYSERWIGHVHPTLFRQAHSLHISLCESINMPLTARLRMA